MNFENVTKSLLTVTACGFMTFSSVNAATTIDANTLYNAQDFSSEVLTAGAADLGTAAIKFTNLSNTSWSNTPTATPHFSNIPSQVFRGSTFDGADWSGVTFTHTGAANQFFMDSSFVNANFNNATFTLTSSNGTSEAFLRGDLSGADLSGTTINVGSGTGVFNGSTFSSTTDFSGSTILSGKGIQAQAPSSLGGANFSNASLRIQLEGTDLSGVNFQNTVFVTSDGISSWILNSVAEGTDFRGADFSGIAHANHLPTLTWTTIAPMYDENTIFTANDNQTFDPVAAGWTLVAIPEPSTLTLLGIGMGVYLLIGRGRRKR